ncbi:MAG: hypothetical protein A2180_03325 [Pseudomonadales bacterium GWC2_63_15]|nr:MAG: hypothetical protein A2180_03325 [Pseudomonadales bacterium GWC2_63_15]
MLNAVFSGKKRGTGLQNQQTTLELAEGAEDVLTASVFERLAYLPDELLTAVLSELLGAPSARCRLSSIGRRGTCRMAPASSPMSYYRTLNAAC